MIGDGAYEAEEGMTFGDWVETEYNTDGFKVVEDNGIADSTAEHFVALDGVGVKSVDTIIDEKTYTLEALEATE